jgi:hypothetical protein
VTVPTALAACTFLYVATIDLPRESFHEGQGHILPFVVIMLGVVLMYAVGRFGLCSMPSGEQEPVSSRAGFQTA